MLEFDFGKVVRTLCTAALVALIPQGEEAVTLNTIRSIKPSRSRACEACDSELWDYADTAAHVCFDWTRAAGSEAAALM